MRTVSGSDIDEMHDSVRYVREGWPLALTPPLLVTFAVLLIVPSVLMTLSIMFANTDLQLRQAS